MKKFVVCCAVLALAVFAVPSSHAASTFTASFTFTGYCDGMTLTYTFASQIDYGTHDNYDCNGSEAGVGGFLTTFKSAAGVGFNPGVPIADAIDGPTTVLIYCISKPTTAEWTLFLGDGTGLYVVNGGGYTINSKAQTHQGVPSWRK